jgi:YHS domain-containing protein
MASRTVKDVVCGMEIDPGNAAATIDYQDTTYYFCSQDCHENFMADPERYARR